MRKVKYILMTYGSLEAWDLLGLGPSGQPTWPQDKVEAHFAEMEAFLQELTEAGELVGGFGMADPTRTQTVDGRTDSMMVTDGPYAEAKEYLAGFCVVDCASHDRAVALAARFSKLVDGPAELRPVQD